MALTPWPMTDIDPHGSGAGLLQPSAATRRRWRADGWRGGLPIPEDFEERIALTIAAREAGK